MFESWRRCCGIRYRNPSPAQGECFGRRRTAKRLNADSRPSFGRSMTCCESLTIDTRLGPDLKELPVALAVPWQHGRHPAGKVTRPGAQTYLNNYAACHW